MTDFEIVPLAAHVRRQGDAVATLAGWFEAEWAPYYVDGPGDAAADLAVCCRTEGLPLALVATAPDGTLAGTAALKAESMASHRHLSPWLAALLVAPKWRNQGAGGLLAAAVADEARRQGFEEIFCGTSPADTLLPRLGWTAVGHGPTLRGDVVILRRALGAA